MLRRPPRSTLFPSPPLFRSPGERPRERFRGTPSAVPLERAAAQQGRRRDDQRPRRLDRRAHEPLCCDHLETRSEEHTSELQSRQYLVCRLLLEKKKKTPAILSIMPPTIMIPLIRYTPTHSSACYKTSVVC